MNKLEEDNSAPGNNNFQIEGAKGSTNMETSKLVLVAVLVLACCSVVAVVLAAVALSKSNESPSINIGTMPGSGSAAAPPAPGPIIISSGGGSAGASNSNGQRVFTIATGHNWGPHEYLDKEGYIAGFSKDLITAVCEAASIDCRRIWDKDSNCWNSDAGEHSTAGFGIMARWYDGCLGWDKTVSRIQSLAFSTSYLRTEKSSFYVKKGAVFDAKDIRGKKIGFIDGHAYDEKCVARQGDIQGSELELSQIFHYKTAEEAVDALLAGKVDALSGDNNVYAQWRNDIEPKGEFQCTIAGASMMTRKDNDFISYWNQGFAKIQSNGQFKKICDAAKQNHGDYGDVNCI